MDSIPRAPGIYVIRNLVNGHLYVGSSINLLKRYREHFRTLIQGKHGNGRLQRSYTKHGKSAFVFEVIEHVPDIQMLITREQHYIDTLSPYYNIRIRAESNLGIKHPRGAINKGRKASPETRQRLSVSHRGKKSGFAGREHTEESRNKMSLSRRLNPSRHWLGKKRSDETIQKIRIKRIGRPINDRQRAGLALGSKARIGTKHTEEALAKMRGPLSAEHRAKLSKAWEHRRERPISDKTRRRASESAKRGWEKRRAAKQTLLSVPNTTPMASLNAIRYTQFSLWNEGAL